MILQNLALKDKTVKTTINGKKYDIDSAVESLISKKAGEPLAGMLEKLDMLEKRHNRILQFGFWSGLLLALTFASVPTWFDTNKLGVASVASVAIGGAVLFCLIIFVAILIILMKRIDKEKDCLCRKLVDLFDGLSCLVRYRPDASGEMIAHLNLRDIKMGILLEAQDIRWLEQDYMNLDSNSPARHILISARDNKSHLLSRMLTAARELCLVIPRESVFNLLSSSTPIGIAICPKVVDSLVFSGDNEFYHS